MHFFCILEDETHEIHFTVWIVPGMCIDIDGYFDVDYFTLPPSMTKFNKKNIYIIFYILIINLFLYINHKSVLVMEQPSCSWHSSYFCINNIFQLKFMYFVSGLSGHAQ